MEGNMSYSLRRECRIIEDKYAKKNKVLSGNSMVEVSVRTGELGSYIFEYVDYVMAHIERLNHSNIYKGVVEVTYIFWDNEYGTIGVDIEYVLPQGISVDIDEGRLFDLLQTEYDGIGVVISEIKLKKVEYKY